MIETILIGRDRKTGKDVLLAGREIDFRKQIERYRELCAPTNEEFSEVILCVPQAYKKPLRFMTKEALAAREKAHSELAGKAAAESKPKAEKSAPDAKSTKPKAEKSA